MATTSRATIDDIQVAGQLWDWKDRPEFISDQLDDLHALVEPFGLCVYEDPSCEGLDTYGVIVSEEALSDDQLDEASRKLFPDHYEDDDSEEDDMTGGGLWADDDSED
jgi:hypothetical protein